MIGIRYDIPVSTKKMYSIAILLQNYQISKTAYLTVYPSLPSECRGVNLWDSGETFLK